MRCPWRINHVKLLGTIKITTKQYAVLLHYVLENKRVYKTIMNTFLHIWKRHLTIMTYKHWVSAGKTFSNLYEMWGGGSVFCTGANWIFISIDSPDVSLINRLVSMFFTVDSPDIPLVNKLMSIFLPVLMHLSKCILGGCSPGWPKEFWQKRFFSQNPHPPMSRSDVPLSSSCPVGGLGNHFDRCKGVSILV